MINPPEPPGSSPFADESGAADAHLPPGPTSGAWRLLDRLVVIVVAIGIVGSAALLAAGVRPSAVENRPLLTAPPVGVDGLLDGSWAKGVDAFLADNMAARPYAVRLRALAYWLTGGSGNPEVVRGRDAWLFVRGEFQPKCRLTAEALGSKLAQAADAFAAGGQAFRFLLIPDKHSVYPEQVRPEVPFEPACHDIGRAVLRDALGAMRPDAIDAAPLLANARREPGAPLLYYESDTHWTPSGAIVAIRALIESIEPEVWADADVVADGRLRRRTDLAALIGLSRFESTPRIKVRSQMTQERTDVPVPTEIANARSIFRIQVRGDGPLIEGRTVIVYDSFFGIYVPLIAPFFADSTWVHVGDLLNHPELGAALGTFDTVILERVERGLYETDVETVLRALQRPAGTHPHP